MIVNSLSLTGEDQNLTEKSYTFHSLKPDDLKYNDIDLHAIIKEQ
jgi:hypothetical protein